MHVALCMGSRERCVELIAITMFTNAFSNIYNDFFFKIVYLNKINYSENAYVERNIIDFFVFNDIYSTGRI